MKIKVGNKVYDGEKEAVMVILEDQDKENIKDMLPEARKYCMYPKDTFSKEYIFEWMGLDDDPKHRTSYIGGSKNPEDVIKT